MSTFGIQHFRDQDLLNLVSSTGLYLPTSALVSCCSQLLYVHASAYDRLLADSFFSFEFLLTFLDVLLLRSTQSCNSGAVLTVPFIGFLVIPFLK